MITFKAKTEDGELVDSTLHSMTFPAGEAHIKTDPYTKLQPTEIAIVQFSPESMHTDLFLLEMWGQFIELSAPETYRIVIMPYLPGARADKGLPRGATSYALFLASIGIDFLAVADTHSPYWLGAYGVATEASVEGILYVPSEIIPTELLKQYDGIIAPDAGALKRATGVADAADRPIYTATKERDFETGHLTKFNVPEGLPTKGKFLIVDDICDGGGTFSGLSLAVLHHSPDVELDLYVTHGIFSGDALHDLSVSFGKIYTTNSYLSRKNDNLPEQFEVIDLISMMLEDV